MSESAREIAVMEVRSPKGLTEATNLELARRLQHAADLLSQATRPAIEAWEWALRHGYRGYRSTLRAAGVAHSGHLQRSYTVARALVSTETSLDDLMEAAGSARLEDLARAARDLLIETGLTKTRRGPRTPLEIAARVVDAILRAVENLEKPRAERRKSNPALPRPGDVPSFNVRECLLAALSGQRVNIELLADMPEQAVSAMQERE